MTKALSSREISPTLTLWRDPNGVWIYDKVWQGNLAMKEPDEETAFIRVIEYYQQRNRELTENWNEAQRKLDAIRGVIGKEED